MDGTREMRLMRFDVSRKGEIRQVAASDFASLRRQAFEAFGFAVEDDPPIVELMHYGHVIPAEGDIEDENKEIKQEWKEFGMEGDFRHTYLDLDKLYLADIVTDSDVDSTEDGVEESSAVGESSPP